MTHADLDTSVSPNRRTFMKLLTGGSLALAAGTIAGCSGWNMKAPPAKPLPKTHISGHRGGPGGGLGMSNLK